MSLIFAGALAGNVICASALGKPAGPDTCGSVFRHARPVDSMGSGASDLKRARQAPDRRGAGCHSESEAVGEEPRLAQAALKKEATAY